MTAHGKNSFGTVRESERSLFSSGDFVQRQCAVRRSTSRRKPLFGMRTPIMKVLLAALAATFSTWLCTTAEARAATPLEAQIGRLHVSSSVERAQAAREIGRMGAYAAPAVPDLVRLLGDRGQAKPWTERFAEATFSMLNPLAPDRASTVGEQAALALVQIGAAAVDALIAAAGEQNDDVRIQAVWALRLIGDARASDVFRAGLRDQNERVRFESIWSIAEANQPDTVTLLAPLLEEGNENIRINAIHGLARAGGAGALGALTGDLNDRDVRFRMAVCEVLGNLQSADVVPPLVALLRDSEWAVRMSAARSLGLRKDPRAVRPLIDALDDQHGEVRDQAGSALVLITGSQLGPDRAQWETWWREQHP